MKKKSKSNAITELESMMDKHHVDKAHAKARDMLFQIKLADLRKEAGLTQEDISDFSQSGLSKIESRSDMKISTLIQYLHSIGMKLEIKATRDETGKTKKKKEYILLKE